MVSVHTTFVVVGTRLLALVSEMPFLETNQICTSGVASHKIEINAIGKQLKNANLQREIILIITPQRLKIKSNSCPIKSVFFYIFT